MALHARPLIAINGLLTVGEKPKLELATRYADAVLKAGGIPVVIPPIGGPSDVERLLDRVDGLLLSGGDDFDTQRLGLGPVHAAATLTPTAKQDFDFVLVRAALQRALPLLGICYGMQLMGVNGGSALFQHLPDDRPHAQQPHAGGVEHVVHVEPDTRLARVMREERLSVVSRHHQALASVASPWRVCARDAEGLIEAIEHATHPFALGVQWHPELAREGTAHDRLFQGLVGAAAMAATGKLAHAAARYPLAARADHA